MIERSELAEVGKFQKPHGLKGELNVLLDIDPDFFTDGNPMIVDADGAYVPFYAESVRSKGATSFLVKIDGLDSHEEARRMVNKMIYAGKDALKEYFGTNGEEFVIEDDLEGYEVSDLKEGHIGTVSRVDDATDNVLLVVADDSGEEIYIPLASDFIEEIDDEERVVLVDIPDALLHLNRKN